MAKATKKTATKATAKKVSAKVTAATKKETVAKKTATKTANNATSAKTTNKTTTKKKAVTTKAANAKSQAATTQSVKKAATKKVSTAKKTATKKAVATKKTATATKAKTTKVNKPVATTTKAKSTSATKKVPATKTTSTKSSPVAKGAKNIKSAKTKASATATKKSATTTAKKVSVKKASPKTKATTVKSTPQKATKTSASRRSKKEELYVNIKPTEIVDAVTKKTTVKESKPGVIAHRDYDRRKKVKPIPKVMDSYNPPKKSLLDDPEQNLGPVYRYSDEDLEEFKALINKKLDRARENLNYYQALMSRKDESGTDDTDNRFNSMEEGSLVMEREQLSQMASRQVQYIDHLEKALVRIENKTYGICRETGKLIDKKRLRAVPHATLSIEAKNNRK